MILKNNYNLNQIKKDLNKKGYSIINNIFEDKINSQIKSIASENITKFNNKKFSLHEKHFSKSFFEELINSKEIINFFKSINIDHQKYKGGYNYHFLLNYSPKTNEYKSKLSYHFDAYLLTMIIPINTNSKQNSNKAMSLEIIPNFRKITNSMFINLIYKTIFQNKIFRKFSNTNIFTYFFKSETLIINYNQIIIFNGFRSLHSASIPKLKIQNEKTRLIFHIFNPFIKDPINDYIFKKIQKNRDKKIFLK